MNTFEAPAMSEAARDAVSFFLLRLAELHAEIVGWLQDLPVTVSEHLVEMDEELTGPYEAPGLKIQSGSRLLAELRPAGADVIGARGRTDLHGLFDDAMFLWMEPQLVDQPVTCSESNGAPGTILRLYVGVRDPGWYWLPVGRRRVYPLTRQVFIDVLNAAANRAFSAE